MAASEAPKAAYILSIQQQATAKGILILSIDLSMLINKCTICFAKKKNIICYNIRKKNLC